MSVTESSVASLDVPIIRVEIDDSGNMTNGILVIQGPKGDKGDPYLESEEFNTLAQQIQTNAANAANSASAAADSADEAEAARDQALDAVGNIVVFIGEDPDGLWVDLSVGGNITVTEGTEPSPYPYEEFTFIS